MKLIIDKYGDTTYHANLNPRTTEFEEGRSMIRIYDTAGQTEFVAAYNTNEVESIYWDR